MPAAACSAVSQLAAPRSLLHQQAAATWRSVGLGQTMRPCGWPLGSATLIRAP